MKLKLFATLFCFALLGLVAVPRAKADSGNERFDMTVKNGPIELPGRVLGPGSYQFKFTDLEHNTVLVTTADGSEPIGFFNVIPISRAKGTDHTKLLMAEPAKNAPERLTGFFYPGLRTGYEFMYPQSQPGSTANAMSHSAGSHS